MPTITLSEQTYAKMKLAAEPFVDTEDSVVSRALDALFQLTGKPTNSNGQINGHSKRTISLDPGSQQLAHTRLLSAVIDGRPMYRPKWNGIMNYLHELAIKRLGSFEQVRKASGANLRQGSYEENGYKYLPEADLSIQGVDSNLACEHSFRLARAMNIPLRFEFEWREKDGAAYPGQTGEMEWTPKTHS